MPKFPTFPTLYNEALQLSITELKEWDYLNPDQKRSGILTWSRNGNKTGSISIEVNTYSDQPYIELNYRYRDQPRNYKVRLVSMPSNLGKGIIWYFFCPQTNLRCRKLYSVDGYFLHRKAFKGCMYESQTQSKKWRQIEKVFGCYFNNDKNYEKLYSKHFKKYYNGKPTRKYQRIKKEIDKAEKVSAADIEALLLM